jgi:hypothetical protein
MTTLRRATENERAFRAMNERIEELEAGWRSDEPLAFVCECSDVGCTTAVYLTLDEYRLVRAKPLQFFVVPDHVDLDVERVVRTTDRYSVVEKLAEPE